MKQIFSFITILTLNCIQLGAQTTDVVTGLNHPTGMILNGNDLYFSHNAAVSKIDITSATPTTATDVATGLQAPNGLALNGNDLYIVVNFQNKISKIDLTETNPTVTDIVTGLNNPSEILINGNDLYILEFGIGKISKIDITAITPTMTDVVNGLSNPNGLALNGNDLYVTQIVEGVGKISKIDITETTPTITDVVNGLLNAGNLRFNGNDLYFTQFNSNTLSKIDITETTPTITDVVTINDEGGENVVLRDVVIVGNDIYISVRKGVFDGAIVKHPISTLSIDDDFAMNHSIKFHPNPTNDFIQVSGLNNADNFVVFDVLGAEVFKGVVSLDGKIDVQKLTNGTYFLKMDNYDDIIKFIKK